MLVPASIVITFLAVNFPKILYPAAYLIVKIVHIFTYLTDDTPEFYYRIISVIGLSIYPVVIMLFYLFLKKLFYNCVTFSLDDTGITYTINFIIYSQKHVNYSDIKEINLDQGPLQRLFKLATIKITTHATTANAGIELYNLKPYHEVYEFLMSKKNSK